MNLKRQLHTLHVKFDDQFKTLSKIALAQLLLKLIYIKGNGALMRQIRNELNGVVIGNISQREIDDAVAFLVREEKIRVSGGRHFIHEKFLTKLKNAKGEAETLHELVIEKYFGAAASQKENIREWFQDTTITFFEIFSFEWFYQVAYKKKRTSIKTPNLKDTLTEILNRAINILEEDKEWLKKQYNKFIDSDGYEENLLFWQYGISMFSSRLITAKNYADQISIEMFKDSKFILDTNILMVLDLEGHELNDSLKSLEKVLIELNINPVYFDHTREEYLRAMSWRKQETVRVFENYTVEVLKASDCPFIQTALKRHCVTEEDLNTMFDQLMDIPTLFHDSLPLRKLEYKELNDAIIQGETNSSLRDSLNDVFIRKFKRDKREKPLIHDIGLISGANFLSKKERCWIVTNDSVLKLYALENVVRDENEIAVGLDVILGVLAINSGGINVEASNFAPLFKNIIKYALIPESTAFEVQDLAFILNSNNQISELGDQAVIEIAKGVKRRRAAGEDDESISLYLRRMLEGEKLEVMQDLKAVQAREQLTMALSKQNEKEKNVFIANYRARRIGELQDIYKRELRVNQAKLIFIPILILILLYLTVNYWAKNISGNYQFLTGCVAEAIFSLVVIYPINKKFRRKYTEYVTQIDELVDGEVFDLLAKAKQ